jgi:predicted nucleotidyltransferase
VRDLTSAKAMAAIVAALGDWGQRIVFIGGAVAPLLQTDPPLPRVRPTDDVDAIAATLSYPDYGKLEQALRDAGFKHGGVTGHATHAHRWYTPDGTKFDLVPYGDHLGASGNQWDEIAARDAVSTIIDGVEVRHVSATGFLVLKWAAYVDRGASNPIGSEDIEDILGVLASRPTILGEITAASAQVRTYLRDCATALIAHPDFADALDAHLSPALNRAAVVASVRTTLKTIAV